ncbi:uncharacterized protein At4g08330, chloroplastic-like [Ananas comosus]|uniref:Uncharacterized protein At4g08330, chloroplastic-like n=1 Tax=Ananas comosus TaxID=4615 RepID=A0A199W3J4_ANACO|nr:uncharacterized protein At4g08330, chloroplastic-like [Ananas comosus]OAY83475.1 Uncharacterized protein, chloroplastic [Ananas comosus]
MVIQEGSRKGAAKTLDSFSSTKDVTYSCGYCGYALNLSSSNRNTSNIGSKYGKAIKKGIVSFFAVDESRFTQSDEFSCLPYFNSKNSWGFLRKRTKLLCRKCGNYIGSAYDEVFPSNGSDGPDSSSEIGVSDRRKYNIKISALQPLSDDSGNFLSTQ